MNDHSSHRAFKTAMGVWLLASIAAVGATGIHPALGLAIAAAGGLIFGLLSARRVQARRVRIGRRPRSEDDT